MINNKVRRETELKPQIGNNRYRIPYPLGLVTTQISDLRIIVEAFGRLLWHFICLMSLFLDNDTIILSS